MMYGSLQVPPTARSAVDAAFAYLRRDGVERTLIDRLERAPEDCRIAVNRRGNDSYDPNAHVIHWDPTSALRTTTGGRQSPALGLGHEIDHAVEAIYRPATSDRLSASFDAAYDDKEERRVITGSETHAARTLGEDTRRDHAGSLYRVSGPALRRAGVLAA